MNAAMYPLILLTAFVCSSALARDIVVDAQSPAANDANPGTSALPLRTLTAGLAQAMPGDTIVVKPGRYTDPNATWYSAFTPARSGTATAPITIKADPLHGATLVPRGYLANAQSRYPALSIYQRQYIVVDGFKAEGMMMIFHDVFPKVRQNVTIQNCDILFGSQLGDDPSLNWGLAIHVSDGNTLRNNRVSRMRSSGNSSENTGAVMLFAAAHNIIENNDADAGNGVVYSAFGQKAGQINNNVWRRNVARNATAGFLGKGSTSGDAFSDNETFYQNVIIDSDRAFSLNHNSRYWRVYNNTAYNVRLFMNQWQFSSIDNQYWNNLVVPTRGVYQLEIQTTGTFSPYVSYSDYNFFGTGTSAIGLWNYGGATMGLEQWRSSTGFDRNSVVGDPRFIDASGGDFRLHDASVARGRGRNGESIGAYITGAEQIGVSFESTVARPQPPGGVTAE